MAATTILTGTGRVLGMTAFGDPSADRVVIFCHPTPGASFDPDPLITERWGLRLVGIDRPGYDSSHPVPEAQPWTLATHAADIAEYVHRSERVADRISRASLDRYGVIGWGTGGLVAAAIAASDPKVDRLALVGVPRPAKVPRLIDRALRHSDLTALGISEDDADLDRHLGLLGRLERMLDHADVQGDSGIRQDQRLLDDPGWIEQLAHIRADTRLWVGERDPLVADFDARWYARRIPGARASRVQDSGPLAIAAAWRSVLAHVAPNHGSIAEELRDSGDVRVADLDARHPESGPFSARQQSSAGIPRP